MRVLFFLCFLVLLTAGCGNLRKEPRGKIISREKMQAAMWDVLAADAFTEQFIKRDSSKDALMENMKLQQQIFAIHNISKQDYYTSYEYYLDNTDLMRVILDSMTTKAERERTGLLERQMNQSNRDTISNALPVALPGNSYSNPFSLGKP